MNIWNSWATAYRNARGLGAAAVLLLAILSLLSLRCNPLVDRASVLGLVLAIEEEVVRPLGEGVPQARILVATPDSTEILLLLPPPVPRGGDFVPLTVERYKKGNVEYGLDLERWRRDGPQ
jgi:hypothetical protein